MTKEVLLRGIAKWRLRMDRGNALQNMVLSPIKSGLSMLVGGGIMLDLLNRYTDWHPSMWLIIPLVIFWIILQKVLDCLIGYWDEIKGFWRIEQEYNTKNINPFFEQLNNKIDKLLYDR